MNERKIGEGHVAAMGRLGLKELRNAISPSRDSVADSEIGLYGTQTQGEIAQARAGPGHGPEEESPEKTTLDDMRRQAGDKTQESQRGKEQGRNNDQGKDKDQGVER